MRGSSEADSGGFNCALPWGVLKSFFFEEVGGGRGGLLIFIKYTPLPSGSRSSLGSEQGKYRVTITGYV